MLTRQPSGSRDRARMLVTFASAAVLLVALTAWGQPVPIGDTEGLLIACCRGWPGQATAICSYDAKRGVLVSRGPGMRALWSPNRSLLAYVLPSLVGLMDTSGQRTEGPFPVHPETCRVSWSPDGALLALTAGEADSTARSVWIAETSRILGRRVPIAPRSLAAGKGEEAYDPAFSPDGRHLAFCHGSTVLDTTSLRRSLSWCETAEVMRPDAPPPGGPVPPDPVPYVSASLGEGDFRCERPQWSGDGKRIGFTRFDLVRGQPEACWVAVADRETRLFPVPYDKPTERNNSTFLGWLAEGAALVGMGPPGRRWQGGLYMVSGTSPTRLAEAPFIWDADLSPDGRYVALIAGNDPAPGWSLQGNVSLLLVNLATRETRTLVDVTGFRVDNVESAPWVPVSLAW